MSDFREKISVGMKEKYWNEKKVFKMSSILKINTKKFSIVTDGKTVSVNINTEKVEKSLEMYHVISEFLKSLEKKGVLK